MKRNKKIILPIVIIFILVAIIGISYAIYVFQYESSDAQLIAGDIYLNYTGSNTIELQDAIPGSEYNNYFEFTISGVNDYKDKDIYYDINLVKGAVPTGKSEDYRIPDEYLKFKLVEVNNSIETELFTDKTYEDLTNQRVYVATVPKNTTQGYSKTYRLYMAISDTLIIGNVSSAIYTPDEWLNAFATISVKVTGDFEEKSMVPLTSTENIISKVVSYSDANASSFTGGLVAINTSGTLYNETDASQAIREYRYSGPVVNNYVFFDTDGDSVKDDNEIWRIVGMFKNSAGEWNLKLMRNTMLTSAELPSTYTYNGTSYTIEYNTTGYAYWNSTNTATNYNDWTTAGLQYYLNGTDGYFGTLSSGAQALVDTSYTYYLGNFNYETATAISGYTDERDASNIWSGNQATWSKSTNTNANGIALLYPSDYGYSASSSYWSDPTLYNYETGPMDTSWMFKTANHTTNEWMLSPSSGDSSSAARWYTTGYVDLGIVDDFNYGVRPVLNLKSTATIDTNHEGTEADPYILIE